MRTYNTIINACNRAGLPENALQVYERMIADGAQPSATTYTALISAYGKTGQVLAHLGSCIARCCIGACSKAHVGATCSNPVQVRSSLHPAPSKAQHAGLTASLRMPRKPVAA